MQIDENRGNGTLWLDACDNGHIDVDGQSYDSAICLTDRAVLPVNVAQPGDLTIEHFQAAIAAHPEVILIGTGNRQIFLHPRLTAQLAAHGIGLETMNTPAACRTYMILKSELRTVWAWLWPA